MTAAIAFSAMRRGSRNLGVAALAQLGNLQVDVAGAGLPEDTIDA
jgi:hypothetical protein